MRSLIKDEANISCQIEFMHVSADAHYGNSIECKFKLPGTQALPHSERRESERDPLKMLHKASAMHIKCSPKICSTSMHIEERFAKLISYYLQLINVLDMVKAFVTV